MTRLCTNKLFLLFVIFLVFQFCARKTVTYSDRKYWVARDVSRDLERLQESVKLISSVCYYRGYVLSEDLKITVEEVRVLNIRSLAIDEFYFNKSVSSSSVIIYSDISKALLVTCAHVISFPDTLIRCYRAGNGVTRYVEAVSYKRRQKIYVSEIMNYDSVEVLLSDEKMDIAFLLVHLSPSEGNVIRAYDFAYGNSNKVELGDVVFILGYPNGYKMVTCGIVGKVDGESEIIVDAPFNRGASGAMVVAVREGHPCLELIGLARSASADFLRFLVPEKSYDFSELGGIRPYRDEIYVGQYSLIKYGITLVIPVNRILNYMKKHRKIFERKGINFSLLRL